MNAGRNMLPTWACLLTRWKFSLLVLMQIVTTRTEVDGKQEAQPIYGQPCDHAIEPSLPHFTPLPPRRTEVEDKLEEMEPGRKHLSGFYVRRGHEVTAGGRRVSHVFLVRGWAGCWGSEVGLPWRRYREAAEWDWSPPVLCSLLHPQATEIIKSASNIRNTRFHIQRPNVGSVESKRLQV